VSSFLRATAPREWPLGPGPKKGRRPATAFLVERRGSTRSAQFDHRAREYHW